MNDTEKLLISLINNNKGVISVNNDHELTINTNDTLLLITDKLTEQQDRFTYILCAEIAETIKSNYDCYKYGNRIFCVHKSNPIKPAFLPLCSDITVNTDNLMSANMDWYTYSKSRYDILHNYLSRSGSRNLLHVSCIWRNRREMNYTILKLFTEHTNMLPELNTHRNFIESTDYGYGDRAFHYMWKLLVDQMPSDFKFLEIGVFKGQVLSLVKLLSDKASKHEKIYGITPLNSDEAGHYASNKCTDYYRAIADLYSQFSLDFSTTTIIKGYSEIPETVERTKQHSPFDLVYIDGSHKYDTVKMDIQNYGGDMLKVGGILVTDDSAVTLDMPENYWAGIPAVSNAVRDTLESNSNFMELFACGHNRVWLKCSSGISVCN